MRLEIDVIDQFVVLNYDFSSIGIVIYSLIIGSGAGNFGVSVVVKLLMLLSHFGCFGMLGCTGIRLFVILVF